MAICDRILSALGTRVIAAADSSSAVEHLRTVPTEVVQSLSSYIMPAVCSLPGVSTMSAHDRLRSRTASILTDEHFWVPVVILLGGLILLRFIR